MGPAGRGPVESVHQDPRDLRAEQIVLGSLMLSAPVLAGVRELVDGEAFYRPAHALIWEAINALADRGEPFDPVPVRVELGRAIAKVGGAGYLVDLIESVPTTANAAYYAQIVRDLAFRRRVIETGTRLIQFGHNTDVGDLRALVTVELAMTTGTDVHGWAAPLPLSSVSKLPPFPVLAFPDWMGEFVVRLAEQTQTPPWTWRAALPSSSWPWRPAARSGSRLRVGESPSASTS